jgi:hypothetical protein
VTVVACLLVLVACGDDAEPTSAGQADVVVARPDVVDGDRAFVQLPGGRLDLVVSEPRDSVTADEAADSADHQADAGEALLGVAWQYLPGTGVATWQRSLVDDPHERIELALVTDGEAYPLGDGRRTAETPDDVRSAGDFFLPVTGSGDDVRVEVTYAGQTQAVDVRTGEREPGSAGPLYVQAPAPQLEDCSDQDWVERGSVEVQCGWWTAPLPYVAGLGWADDAWTVAHLETRTTSYAVDSSSYQLGELTDRTTLAGEPPAATFPISSEPGDLAQNLVFPSSTGTLGVARDTDAALLSGDGPETTTLKLRASLEIG